MRCAPLPDFFTGGCSPCRASARKTNMNSLMQKKGGFGENTPFTTLKHVKPHRTLVHTQPAQHIVREILGRERIGKQKPPTLCE